jgi:excisionase family DNA binding protein
MGAQGPDHPDVINAPFLTVAEVAQRMRVSKMTVYRLVHSGELPAVRFGRSFRVQRAAVEDLIAAARYAAG